MAAVKASLKQRSPYNANTNDDGGGGAKKKKKKGGGGRISRGCGVAEKKTGTDTGKKTTQKK
jgi:hypothetical protein